MHHTQPEHAFHVRHLLQCFNACILHLALQPFTLTLADKVLNDDCYMISWCIEKAFCRKSWMINVVALKLKFIVSYLCLSIISLPTT